jgi:hypothetical protein
MIGLYNSAEEMTKMFESFGWQSAIQEVSKFIKDIGDRIITETPKGNKQASDWSMTYFTGFILAKYDSKILRYGFFNDNILVFKKLFDDYYDWTHSKETESNDPDSGSVLKDKTRRMGHKAWFDVHNKKLQELYTNLLVDSGLTDDNPKSKYISAEDKHKADQECDGTCPMCKMAFTPIDKKVYDHGTPCSVLSDPGKIYVLHEKCNRQKADNTLETAQNMVGMLKIHQELTV